MAIFCKKIMTFGNTNIKAKNSDVLLKDIPALSEFLFVFVAVNIQTKIQLNSFPRVYVSVLV